MDIPYPTWGLKDARLNSPNLLTLTWFKVVIEASVGDKNSASKTRDIRDLRHQIPIAGQVYIFKGNSDVQDQLKIRITTFILPHFPNYRLNEIMMFPQFSMRQRKLIGLFILLIWLTVYALGAMSFAVRYVHDDLLVQTLFYIIAGFAWIIPLKPLLFWMQKKDEPSQPDAE